MSQSHLKFYQHAKAENPQYLVIFLHGYGANGENLITLAHKFQHVLPQARFIAPNAFESWEGGFPHCYQWFSLKNGTGKENLAATASSIRNANKMLADFIDAQLALVNLEIKNLFLVGFSQGAMMAMYQGLSRDQKPAGIISFSGKVILPSMTGEKIASKPEICLIHGESDSVLPFENFVEAKKILQAAEIPFESHAISNLDHAIDIHGIGKAQNFIKKQITAR
jgi:phospholipase/carboxylesterase